MKIYFGFIFLFGVTIFANISCITENPPKVEIVNDSVYFDKPFIQEIHKAYKVGENSADNEIRDIATDRNSNVWVTTAGGVFYKPAESENWLPVISGKDCGPAYSVSVNLEGTILLGTWNGAYSWADGNLQKIEGVEPPISVVCSEGEMTFALGPYGIWQLENGTFQKQPYKIARSVRDAIIDKNGTIWVATDAGLYACKNGEAELFQDDMISCYTKAVSIGPGDKFWVGVMGGVSIRNDKKLEKNLTPNKGIPSIFVNSISLSPDSAMWVGTDVGVVRYAKDGTHSLRFSKRWLADNKVNDVAFDKDGNAWIATANGVSEIKRNAMTLTEKQDYFYVELMKKHIREPWICGVLRLESPGDTSAWRNTDDDNDGEYTGGYLAMESFRYAVTKDEDALIKARKAFGFLSYLYEVTGTDGLFARTIVPTGWKQVNDANRTYTEHQLADELVADPRYKPVEKRWHPSADGKWLWKGDTSSDEMDGHYMSYFFFYEYAATEQDKIAVRNHVSKLTTALMKNNYNFIDIDGTHTRWGVWSPEQLNRDPDWSSEKSLNSFELLAYLKFAAAITGDEKFENEYRRLIDEEGYLENASKLNNKNPAWQIYFDLTMEGYLFPILLKYEKDPELKRFYENLANEWMKKQTAGENLINNLTYALATGKKVNVPQTIEFLKDTPLDLVDWTIDHTIREDVQIVREPILEEVQISELPPASIRATVRWDKNPWAAIQGDPQQVREPVFWLWPYWMARYLEIIKDEN
ncbi:MAG TPA: two-component regulator propeller domain-containing protein [Draconibacterium sp.]|nr:two-component regulator propeller domain-containing protein [Draconibacterium sp.]